MTEPAPMTDEELEAKQALREQKQLAYVPLLNEWKTLNREGAAKVRLFREKQAAADVLDAEIKALTAEINAEIARRATP